MTHTADHASGGIFDALDEVARALDDVVRECVYRVNQFIDEVATGVVVFVRVVYDVGVAVVALAVSWALDMRVSADKARQARVVHPPVHVEAWGNLIFVGG